MSWWISWAIRPLQRQILDGVIQWPHLSASRSIILSSWLVVFIISISGVPVLSVTSCTFDKDSSQPSLELHLHSYLSWWQHIAKHIIMNTWVHLNTYVCSLYSLNKRNRFSVTKLCLSINGVLQWMVLIMKRKTKISFPLSNYNTGYTQLKNTIVKKEKGVVTVSHKLLNLLKLITVVCYN